MRMLLNKVLRLLRLGRPYNYEIRSEKLQDQIYEDQYATEKAEPEKVDLVKTQDFKQTFSSKSGRRVLFHLIQAANMYSSVAPEENLERIEGRREIIYIILRRINTKF